MKTTVKDTAPSAERASKIPWWVGTVVIAGAFLSGMGALLALMNPGSLTSPGDQINHAVHIYAGYMASRNLVLACVLVAFLAMRARQSLATTMMIMGFIQVVDACIDCTEARWQLVPLVLLIGAAFLAGSVRLSRTRPPDSLPPLT